MASVTPYSELWNPFKRFRLLVDSVMLKGKLSKLDELGTTCENLHLRFLSPLKNPPQNGTSRAELEKAKTQGVSLPGSSTPQVLSAAIVDEAFVISDVFQVNEMVALDLILLGEAEMMNFPGLPRGLVATLLYYDGQKDLLHGLATLLEAAPGRTWTQNTDPPVSALVERVRDELVKDGFIGKIIDALASFSVPASWETLRKYNGLGNGRHRRLILGMLRDIEKTCAQLVYTVAAQVGLSPPDAVKVLNHLRSCSLAASASGTLDDPTVTLLIAALYALSPPEVEGDPQTDDSVASVQNFVTALHAELSPSGRSAPWDCPGLNAVLQLAWGLSLRQIAQNRNFSRDPVVKRAAEDDETLVDCALGALPFEFLRIAVLGNSYFAKQDIFVRCVHAVVTDFIMLMPMKVKELQKSAAESGILDVAGADPVHRNFIDFLKLLTELYGSDPLDLDLSLDYWMSSGMAPETASRQVSLHKFVLMAGEPRASNVLVPFVEMLAALSDNSRTAPLCFKLLLNGLMSGVDGDRTVSWDHFVRSIETYHNALQREQANMGRDHPEGTYSRVKAASSSISASEIRGLKAVLKLIEAVGKNDPVARSEFLGRGLWNLPSLLLGFVGCPVPLELKEAILKTLAALCPPSGAEFEAQAGADLGRNIWVELEKIQLLKTIPVGPGMPFSHCGDLRTELEEVEVRQEEYPVSRAFVALLASLAHTGVPPDLGSPLRPPGLEPYLSFVIDSVLMKFSTRVYKDRKEMWTTATTCLNFLVDLVTGFPVVAEDFQAELPLSLAGGFGPRRRRDRGGPGPGYLVMRHVLIGEGNLIRLAMFIIQECVDVLENCEDLPVYGGLLDAALSALMFLSACLEVQGTWQNLYREALKCGGRAFPPETPVDRVLTGVNPRSGKADYLLIIAKFLTAVRWVPKHTREALGILHRLALSKPAQAQMVSLFTTERSKSEILHGFVECLEDDQNEVDDLLEDTLGPQIRQRVLRLILRCLSSPAIAPPNIAHFLLGFNLNEPLYDASLLMPGVMNTQRSCLHAITSILDAGTDDVSHGAGEEAEKLPQSLSSLVMPTTTILCYQILFKLSASEDTGPAILRYLRNSREFLLRHLQMLPLHGDDHVRQMEQMGFLLCTVAVDLTTSAYRGHRTHLARLIAVLLDPDFDPEADGNYVKLPVTLGGAVGSAENCRLAILLKTACKFWKDEYEGLDGLVDLERLDSKTAQKILATAKAPIEPGGPAVYNVMMIRLIMERELAVSGIGPGSAEFPGLQADIEKVLEHAARMNAYVEYVRALSSFFDGWRRVTEALFHVDPPDFVDEHDKQRLLLHIVGTLLQKCNAEYSFAEMNKVASGTVLVLVSCLAQSFQTDRERILTRGRERKWALDKHREEIANIASKVISLILKSEGRERMRIYLYAVLAKLIVMAQDDAKLKSSIPANKGIGGNESQCGVSLSRSLLGALASYGEGFFRVVSNDCFAGHEMIRAMALTCLAQICRLSIPEANSAESHATYANRPKIPKGPKFPELIMSRDFLERAFAALVAEDKTVGALLSAQSADVDVGGAADRTLHVFRAKLILLSMAAVTTSREAAAVVVDKNFVTSLTQLSSLERQAQLQVSSGRADGLDYESQHRSSLVPALRVVAAVYGRSLVPGNRRAYGGRDGDGGVISVLGFLITFQDTLVGVLTTGQPNVKLPQLMETAALSEILSLLTPGGILQTRLDLHSRYTTFRRAFLLLISKYLLSDQAFAEIDKENAAEQRLEARRTYIGILANAVQYASRIVGESKRRRAGAESGIEASECLFGPSLVEGTAREVQRLNQSQTIGMASTGDQVTSVGVVVYQLRKAATMFLSAAENVNLLAAAVEASLNPPSSSSPVPAATPTGAGAASGRNPALANLAKFEAAKLEKKLLLDVVEGCAFLVEHHLNYYLYEAASMTQSLKSMYSRAPLGMSSPSPLMTGGVKREDLVQLKSDMGLALGDQLFGVLKQVADVVGRDGRDTLFLEFKTRGLMRLAHRYAPLS